MLAAANRGQSPCSVPADDADGAVGASAASSSAPPHVMPAALCAAFSLPLFWCMTIFGHLPPQPTNFPLLFVHFLG